MKALQKFKPGVPLRFHLLTAGLVWTVIGGILVAMGVSWIVDKLPLWMIVPALVLGLLKARFVLDRVARRNLKRILQFKGSVCLGSVYSVRMWVMVIGMIIMGRFLRESSLPIEYLGLLYITVGSGLFFSSRIMWKKWLERENLEQP